jgi:hypothetical protein
VLPLFFAVGIIFAPIGGLLLYASAQVRNIAIPTLRCPQIVLIAVHYQVQEISIDYSHCHDLQNGTEQGGVYVDIPKNYTSSSFKGTDKNCSNEQTFQWRQYAKNVTYSDGTTPVDTSVCSLKFNIPDNLHPPVLLYYRLTNFYQNHRRYVKSLDSNQLKGSAMSNNSLGACDPLNVDHNGTAYYPCGLIANSVFNDTIHNPVQLNVHFSNAVNTTYNMTTNGIAWSSDSNLYGPTKNKPEDLAVPPNWYLRYQNGYTAKNLPSLQTDYGFQVWMRTAGLPNFSKLALRNDNETMQCSMYQVDIENSTSPSYYRNHLLIIPDFPVTVYGGTKSIVISTRTVMGGKNPFLGIAYVAVGGICIVLGTIFTITHLIKPRYVAQLHLKFIAELTASGNLGTIHTCHGTTTNPVRLLQLGFRGQVTIRHDDLPWTMMFPRCGLQHE